MIPRTRAEGFSASTVNPPPVLASNSGRTPHWEAMTGTPRRGLPWRPGARWLGEAGRHDEHVAGPEEGDFGGPVQFAVKRDALFQGVVGDGRLNPLPIPLVQHLTGDRQMHVAGMAVYKFVPGLRSECPDLFRVG